MKKSFVKDIQKNALFIIVLIAFVVFTGNKKPGGEHQFQGRCCTGYDISMNKLKKFMLDSLHGNQFEGGVYSKASLLAAINKISGDSVYLMNVLKNCNTAQGTDIALASPQTTGLVFVRKPNCYPCPGKACCPQKVCAARINRSCINYQVYKGTAGISASTAMVAGE